MLLDLPTGEGMNPVHSLFLRLPQLINELLLVFPLGLLLEDLGPHEGVGDCSHVHEVVDPIQKTQSERMNEGTYFSQTSGLG